MTGEKELVIDDRTDSFVPDYSDNERSVSEQYEEYCKKNPLKTESDNKTIKA